MRQLAKDFSARALLVLIATFALLAGGCSNSGGGGGDKSGPTTPVVLPALALERAFPNLTFTSPVAMLQAPGDPGRWYVVERGTSTRNGKVIAFPNNDLALQSDATEFISIPVDVSGEGGLLGMAFHPDFPNTPHVFLSYTRTGPDPVNAPLTTVIARFTSTDFGTTLDPTSEEILLTVDQPYTNHNGGHIAFGPGGLYIGLGDGGLGNDPDNNGQDVTTLLGAILRIDIDRGMPYAIPADNPFATGAAGRPEIYAWGLRNPWRFSFDRSNQRLWLGDVGERTWEEVDIIELGKNYGWKECEGSYQRGSTTIKCATPALTDPVTEYGHANGCSVTGGYVYRGNAITNLYGVYLFGDFCVGTIWALKENPGAAPTVASMINSGLNVVSFGESVTGDLYVVNINGTLHKIVAAP